MVQALISSFMTLTGSCCEANVNTEANETFDNAVPLKKKVSAPAKKSSNGTIKMGGEISVAAQQSKQRVQLHPLMRGKCLDRCSSEESQCIIIKAADLPEQFKHLAVDN